MMPNAPDTNPYSGSGIPPISRGASPKKSEIPSIRNTSPNEMNSHGVFTFPEGDVLDTVSLLLLREHHVTM
jgi:hypothetical protein